MLRKDLLFLPHLSHTGQGRKRFWLEGGPVGRRGHPLCAIEGQTLVGVCHRRAVRSIGARTGARELAMPDNSPMTHTNAGGPVCRCVQPFPACMGKRSPTRNAGLNGALINKCPTSRAEEKSLRRHRSLEEIWSCARVVHRQLVSIRLKVLGQLWLRLRYNSRVTSPPLHPLLSACLSVCLARARSLSPSLSWRERARGSERERDPTLGPANQIKKLSRAKRNQQQ